MRNEELKMKNEEPEPGAYKINVQRYFIIAVFSSCISLGAVALNPVVSDSIPVGGAMNAALQKNYGDDDTVHALVHFYGAKRTSTRITTALLFAASTAAGFAFHDSNLYRGRDGGAYISLFYFLLLLLLIPVSLISFINMFRFNKKQQARRLNDYQSGKPVARWIKQSSIFKNYMRKAN